MNKSKADDIPKQRLASVTIKLFRYLYYWSESEVERSHSRDKSQ